MDVITCPSCSCRLTLPEDNLVTTFLCPRCQKEFSLEEARAPRRSASAAGSTLELASPWNAGDRVLAPWDYPWLYPGTVERLVGDQAEIRFDDGHQGWTPLALIQPLNLGVGDRVFCRWKQGAVYYPGVIDKEDGERIHVRYDDGDKEWTNIRFVRLAPPEVLAQLPTFAQPPAPPKNNAWVSAATVIGIMVVSALLRGCLR